LKNGHLNGMPTTISLQTSCCGQSLGNKSHRGHRSLIISIASSEAHIYRMSSLNVDIADVVANRPLFTGCAAAILVLYTLNFILSDCKEKVGLVTANTLITNTYVWNLVTSCFYETQIAKVAFDLVALLYLTKSLPIPNLEQFGLYFLFCVLACTIGASTYCFMSFVAVARESRLITPIYGFGGVMMSIAMYARHQYRNEIVHPAFPKLTFHHLPIVLLLVDLVLYNIWFTKFLVTDIHFTVIALFFSWSYLRFYYKHGTSEATGDDAEDFSFVSMFPEVRCCFCYLTHENELR
jgi:hypothetical protein